MLVLLIQPVYLLAVRLQVRQRDERFPSDAVAVIEHEQPACLAHSDFSVQGAISQLKAFFPGQQEYFEGKKFDILKSVLPNLIHNKFVSLLRVHSAWRPLVGPNNDWPLALCDYTSINPDHDITVTDVLHRN